MRTPGMVALLDTVMDRTVLPGYTSLGYRARRSLRQALPVRA